MNDDNAGTYEHVEGRGSVSSDEDRIAYLAGEAGAEARGRLHPDERAELQVIRDLLSDPSTWADPDPSLEDRVVAAVTAEAAKAGEHRSSSLAPTVPSRTGRPVRRNPVARARRRPLVLSGALAAAAALVVAVALVVGASGGDSGAQRMTAALSAPPGVDASARATLTRTSAGWRVELHTVGLPRLDNGHFYEAWMKNSAGVLVAIGTFNQGPNVTLWSGVSPAEFSTITVTAQEANGNPASSGQRVLAGTIVP